MISQKYTRGFTLIELSIVLVVIGLIIGGILVGQDMIAAAAIRAQITQIEKFNTAVHTFQGKYGYLPGDIPNPYTTQFGFNTRFNCPGGGDGNGLIQGLNNVTQVCNSTAGGAFYGVGENLLFWQDLSTAALIEGKFNAVSNGGLSGAAASLPSECYPAAKIGNSNYVVVWSDGYHGWEGTNGDGSNYWSVAANNGTAYCGEYGIGGSMVPMMTVQQAYNIDAKTDDGLPQSGRVTAIYPLGGHADWAAGGGLTGASADGGCCEADSDFNAPTNSAVPYATTNCYDNNDVAGTQAYSMGKNAALLNCALSFRFQ